jgi:hypothetical protein
MQRSRRNFLKKTVYKAPVLMLLGTLKRPKNARADHSGGPPGPPGDWNINGAEVKRNRSSSPVKIRKQLKF